MRSVLSLTSPKVTALCSYSTLLSSTAVHLQQRGGPGRGDAPRYGNGGPPPRQSYSQPQRGGGGGGGFGNRQQQGYDNRNQGYGNRDRGFDNRQPYQQQQEYQQRQQGYGNREQDYGERQRGYGNRPQQGADNYRQPQQQQQRGYGNRDGGYDNSNRPQRYGNRQQDFDDRPRSFGNRQNRNESRKDDFGNHRQDDGRPPRRAAEDYFQQNVDDLLRMKQEYKHVKSGRERALIKREARRLARKTHLDPSSQDERAVTIFLNCAATFSVSRSDCIGEASEWMRQNLRAVSPHNLALYTNALGVLEIEKAEDVLRDEVAPLLRSAMGDLTPVEVVMVLQAFQRLSVKEHDELQNALLLQLEPCISGMPVSQLSTLAAVLAYHRLQAQNEEKWRQIVGDVMRQALKSVETVHSKEAVAFMEVAAKLHLPQEQICQLAKRVTDTAGFHTDEQVAQLLVAICRIQRDVAEPTPELTAAVAKLQTVLVERLAKVSHFVGPVTAGKIWRCAAESHTELPTATVEEMCETLARGLTFKRAYLAQLLSIAQGAAALKLPSPKLLHMVARCAVGERPPRPQNEASPAPRDEEYEGDRRDAEAAREAAMEASYGRKFGLFLRLRIDMEDAYAKCGVAPEEALTTTLPRHLEQHVVDARAVAVLVGMRHILTARPDCPYRNVANDEVLMKAALEDIACTPEKYKECVSPAFLERYEKAVSENPKSAKLLEALRQLAAA